MSNLIKWRNQLHCTLGTRGFFFLAYGWMLRCRPEADRSSVEGRSILGHAGHNLKTCLKPETAHEKSLAPTVENAIKM